MAGSVVGATAPDGSPLLAERCNEGRATPTELEKGDPISKSIRASTDSLRPLRPVKGSDELDLPSATATTTAGSATTETDPATTQAGLATLATSTDTSSAALTAAADAGSAPQRGSGGGRARGEARTHRDGDESAGDRARRITGRYGEGVGPASTGSAREYPSSAIEGQPGWQLPLT